MGWLKIFIFIMILMSSVHHRPLELATTTVQIGNQDLEVEVASTFSQQYQGLSGREAICADCGMLFNFSDYGPKSFVMRNMKFPLDIIFIDNGVIKNIAANLPPEGDRPAMIYQSAGAANQVLEVNGGYCAAHNIQAGDFIKITGN